ncbi:unnamed protein product [Brassica oleracea]|uniref:(rape) hypothetical protein n=1 Tax=Brassica napus TaxID=3708 RepID=A0A816IW93_BRANA|nr:unnamed protein product [Brassica napus]
MAQSRHMADIISGNHYRVGSLGRPSNSFYYKLFFLLGALLTNLYRF